MRWLISVGRFDFNNSNNIIEHIYTVNIYTIDHKISYPFIVEKSYPRKRITKKLLNEIIQQASSSKQFNLRSKVNFWGYNFVELIGLGYEIRL